MLTHVRSNIVYMLTHVRSNIVYMLTHGVYLLHKDGCVGVIQVGRDVDVMVVLEDVGPATQ